MVGDKGTILALMCASDQSTCCSPAMECAEAPVRARMMTITTTTITTTLNGAGMR